MGNYPNRSKKPAADEIARLHTLDRGHYDTPGSVRECACRSCNTVRVSYGRAAKRWSTRLTPLHHERYFVAISIIMIPIANC